jgi:hypothetical protein
MRFIVQARQRELEPDAEHQEDHAELGKVARLLGIRHPAGGMRPEHRADQQVAQDRRQTERAEDRRPPPRRRRATAGSAAGCRSWGGNPAEGGDALARLL